MLHTDLKGVTSFISGPDISSAVSEAAAAAGILERGTGAGAEFTGWVTLPVKMLADPELERIKTAAKKIRESSSALVVVGIGGSYLGARAAIELLGGKKDAPDVYFAGNGVSGEYLAGVIEALRGRDFSVNVISKSGTTTEPAVAFRIFRELLREKYGDKAGERIYATTDRRRGALKSLADAEGWECFVVPDDVGGRYSVLTAVGLLPMAAAGIDIEQVLRGAAEERKALLEEKNENPAFLYAAARRALYGRGKRVEVLACFEPAFRFTAEWWKQLYGESEGKNGTGLFPASVEYTADLHSMGQYMQDGERLLLETFVTFENSRAKLAVPFDEKNADGLNYLAGKDLQYINLAAMRATKAAHIEGGVPCLELRLDSISERSFGELVYFFEYACAISGYMGGVNPFDQPGVEKYKKNMFKLLGKPE